MQPAHTPPRRGRPRKFGRPAQLVALTLPTDVVKKLRACDPDLACAIVALAERAAGHGTPRQPDAARDVELAAIAARQSLIVVKRSVFKTLPGIHIVPLSGQRAFLALRAGLSMADLELSIADRIDDRAIAPVERRALLQFRARLRAWRRDRTLRFHTRAIIVVEHVSTKRG